MNWNDNRNLTMLVDFYELTMSNGYFEQGCGDRLTVSLICSSGISRW